METFFCKMFIICRFNKVFFGNLYMGLLLKVNFYHCAKFDAQKIKKIDF